MTTNPNGPQPGDLSPKNGSEPSGSRQFDRDGEEDGHHANTAGPTRENSSPGPGSKKLAPPPTSSGPNTQSNDRGRKDQDNEGQQGGQRGGAQPK